MIRNSNFYNRNRKNSDHTKWNNAIEEATDRVYQNLSSLDFNSLGISDYNNRYINEHLQEFEKAAWFISHIFMLVSEKNKPINSSVFVDYGGGSGILSYIALELGFKEVIYIDIFQTSCDDVAIISKAINLDLTHIVCGDVKKLNDYIVKNTISVDFIVSQDVIEHIYDVKQWYLDLSPMVNKATEVICTSHANLYNPLIANKLMKLHNKLELQDREKQWGAKERDSLKGFMKLREDIILEHDPSISNRDARNLAMETRGLIKQDICDIVDQYNKTKNIAFKPNHKTNTCDPMTGNWSEQLIDLKELKGFLKNNRYHSKISAGFYIDSKGSGIVRLIKKIVNRIIYWSGFNGLLLAPYYIIESNKKQQI